LPDGRPHIVQLLRDGDFFGFGGFSGATYKHAAIALRWLEHLHTAEFPLLLKISR
jgi:CRP/FNR family transcriptional regulator